MAAGGHPGELRIGLTISGAIALGAFEGGALAALLHAVGRVNAQRPGALRIDAMAGASAGSMTAVVAARCLMTGLDPIDAMYEAWVTTPALTQLRDGLSAPLQVKSTEAAARRLLTRRGAAPLQTTPVRVNLALGSLRRLDYEIGRVGGPPVRATTHLDWQEIVFDTGSPDELYVGSGQAMDAALASGAHGVAFRPRGLDRSAPEIQAGYRANGVDGPPMFGWYTDGGTIDNQPLGRALNLTQAIDRDDPRDGARRLHLLITPDPAIRQPAIDAWTDSGTEPRWLVSGERIVTLLLSQHLYDDMRQLEKTNSRISWLRELEAALGAIIDGAAPDATAALNEVIASIEHQKDTLYEDTGHATAPPPATTPARAALRRALELATGEKEYIELAVVSPLNVRGVTRPADVLGGAFLMHFGGFLNERLRENDFAVGYDAMVQWMGGADGLAARGLDGELAALATDGATRGAAAHRWRADLGGATLRSRPLREKLAVMALIARAAAIAVNDAVRR